MATRTRPNLTLAQARTLGEDAHALTREHPDMVARLVPGQAGRLAISRCHHPEITHDPPKSRFVAPTGPAGRRRGHGRRGEKTGKQGVRPDLAHLEMAAYEGRHHPKKQR